MELKYIAAVQGMVLLCFLLHYYQRICVEKRAEGSCDFRKPDIGMSLPMGFCTVMCSLAGMGLQLF